MFKFTFIVSQSTLVAAAFTSSKKRDEIYIEVEGVELKGMQKFGHVDSEIYRVIEYKVVDNMPLLNLKNWVAILPMSPDLVFAYLRCRKWYHHFWLPGVAGPFVTFAGADGRVHAVEPATFYGKIVKKGLLWDNFNGKVIFSYKVQEQDEFKEGDKVTFFGTGSDNLSVLKALNVEAGAATIAAGAVSHPVSVETPPPSDSPPVISKESVSDAVKSIFRKADENLPTSKTDLEPFPDFDSSEDGESKQE